MFCYRVNLLQSYNNLKYIPNKRKFHNVSYSNYLELHNYGVTEQSGQCSLFQQSMLLLLFFLNMKRLLDIHSLHQRILHFHAGN